MGTRDVSLQQLSELNPTPRRCNVCSCTVCRSWRGAPRGAEGQAIDWASAAQLHALLHPSCGASSEPAADVAVAGGGKVLTPADIPLVPPVLDVMARADADAAAGK